MSEDITAVVPPQHSQSELQVWRESLVQRLLRLSIFLGLAILALSGYFYWTAGVGYLLPFIVVLYAAIVVGAVSRLSYTVKAAIMLAVPLVLGGLGLVVSGWGGNARVVLMAGVVFAVIFYDVKTAYRVLIGIAVVLVAFVALYLTGRFTPLIQGSTYLATELWSNFVLFVMFSVALIFSINYIFPRMVEALNRTQALSQNLEDEQHNFSQRAGELERSYEDLQHRSEFLEATVEVTQVFSTAVELGLLLERAVSVMSRAFGYYHIGIFTVDEEAQWADLRAASSDGGRKLVAGGHRLRSGNHSMVGWVLANHQDRVSNAVSDDPYYYANPSLPETTSALTMPLMNADQVIGILDIQSRVPDVFQGADVQLLRGVADQLALAIRNALRLSDEAATMEIASPFYRVARNLATSRTDQETLTMILQNLQEYNASQAAVYRVHDPGEPAELAAVLRNDEIAVKVADETFTRELMAPVVAVGLTLDNPLWLSDVSTLHGKMNVATADMLTALANQMGAASILVAPIRIEERMSGMVIAFYEALHQFSPFERQLIRLLTDLSGVAMERSRLLLDARMRLNRERLLSDVAARMRTTLDMDLVLQGALQEIGERLNIPDIEVRMGAAHPVVKGANNDSPASRK